MSLITIIIPTIFTSPQFLKRCLDSIASQKLSPEQFQVIIVCNDRLDLLKQFLAEIPQSPFEVILAGSGHNIGFAAATNLGIELARTQYIVTMNDDVWVEPDFLTHLVQTQKETSADMVASTIYLEGTKQIDSCGFDFAWRGQAAPLRPKHEKLCSSFDTLADQWLKNSTILPKKINCQPFGPDAAAALYTQRLFDQVGKFDVSFFAYLEDVDLSFRARKQGLSCAWAEKAIAHHTKHVSSRTMGKFKKTQDVLNWWRIVLKYSPAMWLKFGHLILLERGRNLSGWFKTG